MTTLFFVCLGVGAGFVLLSVIFGQIAGALDADIDSGGASPFKPIIIAVFLTVFGGAGLLLMPVFEVWVVLGAAALAGLVMAYLMFRYVVVPLHRWQNTSAHEKQSVIGLTAKVAELIPQGGYGKITYTYDSKIISGPAKSENGTEIARNTLVEIVYIERNTYHVRIKS